MALGMADEPSPKRLKSLTPAPELNASTLSGIPYAAAFTDSLINPLVHPAPRASKASTGLRVIPPSSDQRGKANFSIRYEDIDLDCLPEVTQAELPLPLDDPRRRYASGIPGIRLTHPGGPLEGGVGVFGGSVGEDGLEGTADESNNEPSDVQMGNSVVNPAVTTQALVHPGQDSQVNGSGDGEARSHNDVDSEPNLFAHLPKQVQAFLREHDINTQEQLHAVVKQEQQKQIDELRKRMRERQEAKEKNEDIEEKIQEMVAEREMERRAFEIVKKQKS